MPASQERFLRRSAIVINSSPIYYKDLNSVVYAADKIIVVCGLTNGRHQKFKAHTDTITTLEPHNERTSVLRSAGLDGRIIEWDLRTGLKLKHVNLKLPIFHMTQSVVCLQLKSGYCLRAYHNDGYESYTTIFESPDPIMYAVGAESNQIVGYLQNTKLFIYWNRFNVSTCYSLPHSGSHGERKQFTCIAVHPTDFVVATGNGIGEIFIWYGLTSSSEEDLEPLDDMLPDAAEDQQQLQQQHQLTLDTIRTVITNRRKAGDSADCYYPVHCSRVKRNMVHWHCCSVVSLCFTATGSHLLSGGLEGVMVKWDMTECTGGVQQRRFLPRLGSPIQQVTSPGGPSEDAIVICLQNNGFLVLSGALKVLYRLQGFLQSPRCWLSTSGAHVPENLIPIDVRPNMEQSAKLILANGSMGSLQLIRNEASFSFSKIDVTRQALVPRDDSAVPISYSEVTLIAWSDSMSSLRWLATYECSKKFDAHQVDDAARIVWWQLGLTASGTAPDDIDSLLVPVTSTPLSHIACPAADMGFMSTTGGLLFYILFNDLRLLILRHEHATKVSPDQWIKLACHSLADTAVELTKRRVHATVVDGKSGESFLLVSGSGFLALYSCNDLINEAFPKPVSKLDLSYSLETIGVPFTKLQLAAKPVVLHIRSKADHVIALALTDSSKSATTTNRSGLLCFGRFRAEDSLKITFCDSCPPISCLTAHPSRPLVAVGYRSGAAALFRVEDAAPAIQLILQCDLPAVPAHPACDRQTVHRAGLKNREKPIKVTTRLLSLVFLDHSDNFHLAGLLETMAGRERGRRDLVTYGVTYESSVPEPKQHTPVSVESKNLLQACTPAGSGPVRTRSRKRRLSDKSDPQFEDALRQISQYPVHTAPPPDQLLRQLMDRST